MDIARVTIIAERFCESRQWGSPRYIDNGASAAVFEVDTPTGSIALKIYDPSFFDIENSLIEANRIELQKELKGHGCAYLVDVFEAGELPEAGTWYLAMEYCPWMSLDKRLDEVPDEKVHHLLKQLVEAVKFLDERGLVHRDIKPANIVVSPDFEELKLLDFGVMRRIAHDEGSGTDGHEFIATAQYSPPEFLVREEAPGETGFDAINVYQIGAVLHDLITKSAIFAEEKATRNKFKLFKAVTEKRPRVVSGSVPPRLIALCLAALDKDPQSRIASVALDDFLADADDLDALRRRVSTNGQNPAERATPTLAVWRPLVRSWGMDAARLESETLGAVVMRAETIAGGHRWKLDFAGAAAPIYLELLRTETELLVHVVSTPDSERGAPVFVIDSEGPNLPETGISGALAAQYLYALDLALAAQASRPVDEEARA